MSGLSVGPMERTLWDDEAGVGMNPTRLRKAANVGLTRTGFVFVPFFCVTNSTL